MKIDKVESEELIAQLSKSIADFDMKSMVIREEATKAKQSA